MLTDVDLGAPTPMAPTSWLGDDMSTASTTQNPSTSQKQGQVAPPLISPPSIPAMNRRRTMRGKSSTHFSMKRPRRNVVRRSIATMPQLENIDEERESLLSIDSNMDQKHADVSTSTNLYRAPRIALVLLLLVCIAGAYRSAHEYWVARNHASAITNERTKSNYWSDNLLRGTGDGEHRGALLRTLDSLEGQEIIDGHFTSQNTEDIPTLLFNQTITAPAQLSNFANVFEEQYNPEHNKLFFWHIPRSGSTTITRIASNCMGLTLATEAGKSEAARGYAELQIVEALDGIHFANVDMSNPVGIERAKALHVGQSGEVDIVSSPYLWESAGIFDEVHKGYMVAMFRHPIERSASLYYSMRKNPQYEKQVGSLTSIEQYAKSSLAENNWMTRFLSNTLSGELTPEHEAIAKEVLRTKCLIGLLRNKTETVRRIERFFNMIAKGRTKRGEDCEEKLLYWDWPGKNRHEPVVEGSEAWSILYKQNTFDLRLYEYAEQLFEAQGKLFQDTTSAR